MAGVAACRRKKQRKKLRQTAKSPGICEIGNALVHICIRYIHVEAVE